MVAVRYVALAALVVWVGAMIDVLFGDALRNLRLLSASCGAFVLVSLLVMKFVGPPPHDFFPRAGIVCLMLALVGASALHRISLPTLLMTNTALGFVLLFWYVRE
jgi:hypothetical protein